MKLIVSEDKSKSLCLSKKEFLIISSAIIELSENYHKPNNQEESFSKKLGYSLQENDKLYNEFLHLRSEKLNTYCINFSVKMQKIFYAALKEIVARYEYYEFQIITGFYRHEVQKVLESLEDILQIQDY